MLRKKINAPITSSAGRLFDAVAALVGLCQEVHFEGQAAIEMEFAVQSGTTAPYSFGLKGSTPLIIDWEPAVRELLGEMVRGETKGKLAAKFHNGLAEAISAVARKIGEPQIVLTGGCFQNKYLLEQTARRLTQEHFQVYWHRRIPPNDGGIAVGQIAAAARVLRDGPASQRRRVGRASHHAIA
jgi:hydrogenase maturation protein HypF